MKDEGHVHRDATLAKEKTIQARGVFDAPTDVKVDCHPMTLIAQATQPSINLADFVLPIIPWLIVFGFVWFLVLRMLRGQNAHMRRAREHWDAVERKLDRLIELAERREK